MFLSTLLLLTATASANVPSLESAHVHDAFLVAAFFVYTVVGTTILVRRPFNHIGWVFLAAGLFLQIWPFSMRYAAYTLITDPGALPGGTYAAWLTGWTVLPGIGLAFTLVPLVFPDGTFPGRRSRWVGATAVIAIVVTSIAWATEPGPLAPFDGVENPVGVDQITSLHVADVAWALLVATTIASVSCLACRYRRSPGAVRLQIRWLGLSALLMAAALVMATIGTSGVGFAKATSPFLFAAAVACMPVACLIAILRHDLFELDVVISRTLTFGVLAALITLTYVALVAGVGAALGQIGEHEVAVSVVATAVIAIGFQPLRARVQRLANHLVYGARATPYEVMTELSRRLSDAPDPQTILPRVAEAVTAGTGARRADIWLLLDGAPRHLCSSPPHPPPQVGSLDELERVADTMVVTVRRHGEALGAIAVNLPAGRRLTGTERQLLSSLAAQTGLVLSNVRLLEEIKASRQRLVTAHDEERRRFERDLHDGIQQRLVVLALELRSAARRIRAAAPAGPACLLDGAADEASEILADLRSVARGIHPAVLTQGGLRAGLDSLAERSPVPVTVSVWLDHRPPASVEITAYYVVAEALTNAIKHSSAAHVSVEVDSDHGSVVACVSDDGCGGASPRPDSGLTGMKDRVEALGGSLQLSSAPGDGTRLEARIPCG